MSIANEAQRKYWQTRHAWVDHQAQMDIQLESFGIAAMEALGEISQSHVLDVGCGCGHTTLQLQQRVGNGSVVGVDISAALLNVARSRSEGRADFVEADAQITPLGGPYDFIYSRFGVMFFGNPIAAFENLRSAASNKAKLSFVCWQGPEKNPWITVPNRAAMTLVEMPPRAPDAPDPFSFADPEHVTQILHQAGWSGIDICPYRTEVAVGGRVGLREAALHAYEFGPVKAVAESTGQVPSEDVLRAIEDALAPYEIDGVVQLPGAAWIATAHNS